MPPAPGPEPQTRSIPDHKRVAPEGQRAAQRPQPKHSSTTGFAALELSRGERAYLDTGAARDADACVLRWPANRP